MTVQRFLYVLDNDEDTIYDLFEKNILSKKDIEDKMNALYEENEQLKQDIENLMVTIKARETLINVCEKKFKELGYIITANDDGYVIE